MVSGLSVVRNWSRVDLDDDPRMILHFDVLHRQRVNPPPAMAPRAFLQRATLRTEQE
jgi:hypothetical protein